MKRAAQHMLSLLLAVILLTATMSFGLAEAQSYTAGTYTVTQKGMHGDITMQVVVTDNAIESVEMTDCKDTECIAAPAAKQIAGDVVKYQTANVDACAGATMSSRAIKAALSDCLSQAGADVSAMPKAPAAETVAHDDEEYDVVIVGAGMAGVNAALAAATNDGDSASNTGLRILLIEKLPFAGGSFIVSGAGIFCIYGSPMHQDGRLDTIAEDDYVRYLNERSGEGFEAIANNGLQHKVYQAIYPAELLMVDLGAPFTFDMNVIDPMAIKGEGYSDNAFGNLNFDEYMNGYYETHGYGGTVGDYLGEKFLGMLDAKDNIELRLSTAATGLIVEDGAVNGVVVEQKDTENDTVTTYNIRAKKTILATGSSNLNYGLMGEYTPEYVTARPFCAAGATGDGITLTQDAGLNPSVIGWGGMCYNGAWDDYGMEDGLTLFLAGSPNVNKEGKRYYDEGGTMDVDTGRVTMTQPDNTTYFILDSDNAMYNGTYTGYNFGFKGADETVFDYTERNGVSVKADTLEELAEKIGVPVDTFVATINAFNEAAQGKATDEMGSDPATMVPVVNPPFYAVTNHAYRVESYIGLQTAADSTQLVNAEGTGIDNLYGCGTLVSSNVFTNRYFQYCGGLTTALALGNVAGREVRDQLVNP